jgi:DUF2075 family protein
MPCDELITRPRSPTACKNDHETKKSALCSKVRARGDKKIKALEFSEQLNYHQSLKANAFTVNYCDAYDHC